MSDLIDREPLYERFAMLEAQALDYVGKLIERDGDEVSTEWKIWSAILNERTAFKHDVYDAPTVQPERKEGKWQLEKVYEDEYGQATYQYFCSECGFAAYEIKQHFCHNCGANMEGGVRVENSEIYR